MIKWSSFAVMLFAATCLADDHTFQDLVRQLGADSFNERQQAESQLGTMPRSALDDLRNALSDTDDPEIQMRLKRIVEHILSDASSIPQAYWVLITTERGRYANLAEKFRNESSISTHNTEGTAATTGGFAQSFIPKSATITAIEICAYPISRQFGFTRLDLCMDDHGAPGHVLARSWIWIPENHNFPHGDYIYHDIPDQRVDPSGTYWIVYTEFPDLSLTHSVIANYGFSISGNEYPDGMLWYEASDAPRQDADLKFRIFSSETDPHPAYRKATEEEIGTITHEQRETTWGRWSKR